MGKPEDVNETEERPVTGVRRAPPGLNRLVARVVEGPDAGEERVVEPDEELVVGSFPATGLTLNDSAVSHFHAELVPTAHGIRVRDLGSRSHTHVGGARVDVGIVPAGTRMRVGNTVVALEDGGPVEGTAEAVEPEATLTGVVMESPAMRRVAQRVHEVAPTMASVLLEGERGTGKKTLARAIHEMSPRRHGPFVVVDCGSTAPTLVGAELFGPGPADPQRPGAFQRAEGGTLLLDSIGELPLETQPVLLGVLEQRSFQRSEDEEPVEVDVRVLASSVRDLRLEANAGSFRPELYARLAGERVVVPPLRERPEDVPPLAHHFAREITGRPDFVFDEETLDAFRAHPWGGNAPELRTAVESTVLKGGGGAQRGAPRPTYRAARAEAIAEFERRYLGELIRECDGNASEAARRAHMDRAYLVSLLKKHGLR